MHSCIFHPKGALCRSSPPAAVCGARNHQLFLLAQILHPTSLFAFGGCGSFGHPAAKNLFGAKCQIFFWKWFKKWKRGIFGTVLLGDLHHMDKKCSPAGILLFFLSLPVPPATPLDPLWPRGGSSQHRFFLFLSFFHTAPFPSGRLGLPLRVHKKHPWKRGQ